MAAMFEDLSDEQFEAERLQDEEWKQMEKQLVRLDSVVRILPEGHVLEVGGVPMTREAIRAELQRMLVQGRNVEEAREKYDEAREECRRAFSGPGVPQA